jgi:hypothetical protein
MPQVPCILDTTKGYESETEARYILSLKTSTTRHKASFNTKHHGSVFNTVTKKKAVTLSEIHKVRI